MLIDFKFERKQKVVTPLGDLGIVDMCSYNGRVNLYYVITSGEGNWFDEEDLKLAE